MLTWLRRFLVLVALAFWMGGFAFYGAVVIPVGRRVFDGVFSEVTSPVTYALNVAGAVALGVCLWDGLSGGDANRWRSRGRWLTWLLGAITLGILFVMHSWLDTLMASGEVHAYQGSFGLTHRGYLWLSMGQWFAMLVYTGLTLAAWRDEDRGSTLPVPLASPRQ